MHADDTIVFFSYHLYKFRIIAKKGRDKGELVQGKLKWIYLQEGNMKEQMDISRTEANFKDFTAASKLLEVSRFRYLCPSTLREIRRPG